MLKKPYYFCMESIGLYHQTGDFTSRFSSEKVYHVSIGAGLRHCHDLRDCWDSNRIKN